MRAMFSKQISKRHDKKLTRNIGNVNFVFFFFFENVKIDNSFDNKMYQF